MRTSLGMTGVSVVFVGMFLGVSIGLGAMVHWCLPAIEFGLASVLGALALMTLGLAISVVGLATQLMHRMELADRAEQALNDEDEDADYDSLGPGDIDELGASIANALMARQRMWSKESTAGAPKKRTPRKR